ncbi:hypothetical protein J6590_022591 [Homalodisca vitripennis]|nr:hypothetical protein J6590_022591 [Homalodisca vitripennis]
MRHILKIRITELVAKRGEQCSLAPGRGQFLQGWGLKRTTSRFETLLMESLDELPVLQPVVGKFTQVELRYANQGRAPEGHSGRSREDAAQNANHCTRISRGMSKAQLHLLQAGCRYSYGEGVTGTCIHRSQGSLRYWPAVIINLPLWRRYRIFINVSDSFAYFLPAGGKQFTAASLMGYANLSLFSCNTSSLDSCLYWELTLLELDPSCLPTVKAGFQISETNYCDET